MRRLYGALAAPRPWYARTHTNVHIHTYIPVMVVAYVPSCLEKQTIGVLLLVHIKEKYPGACASLSLYTHTRARTHTHTRTYTHTHKSVDSDSSVSLCVLHVLYAFLCVYQHKGRLPAIRMPPSLFCDELQVFSTNSPHHHRWRVLIWPTQVNEQTLITNEQTLITAENRLARWMFSKVSAIENSFSTFIESRLLRIST
jgi:hypothetical protein